MSHSIGLTFYCVLFLLLLLDVFSLSLSPSSTRFSLYLSLLSQKMLCRCFSRLNIHSVTDNLVHVLEQIHTVTDNLFNATMKFWYLIKKLRTAGKRRICRFTRS